MDASQLKTELARLRKGRGIGRPGLLSMLGPLFQDILYRQP